MMAKDYRDQLIKDIKENFVDDFLNFEDRSVGWYGIGKFDQKLIDEINDDVEGVTVLEWNENSMTIECEGLKFDIGVPQYENRFFIINVY